MHDTKLHTDPEEFVFVRRSKPLTEFDFLAWARNDDPNMTFRFFDASIESARSPRVREMLEEYEREQRGKIFVKPSPERAIDGTRIEPIYFTDQELTDINNGLYDCPKSKVTFDDEPSKSTDK